jgi:hypothetical protein
MEYFGFKLRFFVFSFSVFNWHILIVHNYGVQCDKLVHVYNIKWWSQSDYAQLLKHVSPIVLFLLYPATSDDVDLCLLRVHDEN